LSKFQTLGGFRYLNFPQNIGWTSDFGFKKSGQNLSTPSALNRKLQGTGNFSVGDFSAQGFSEMPPPRIPLKNMLNKMGSPAKGIGMNIKEIKWKPPVPVRTLG